MNKETNNGSDGYPFTPGHRGNSDTAIAAAAELAPHLGKLQRDVFLAVKQRGLVGLTSDEVADALGWERWAVRPRAAELRRLGRIRDSKMRRVNQASGRAAIVWVAVDGQG